MTGKYLVISWSPSEKRAQWTFVVARNEETACKFVEQIYPDCFAVDALTSGLLEREANQLRETTPAAILENMESLKALSRRKP